MSRGVEGNSHKELMDVSVNTEESEQERRGACAACDGSPACIALGNVIVVHVILLVLCILSWINVGNTTTFIQATCLGFVTLVWLIICGIFVIWNFIVLTLDMCGKSIPRALRNSTAHYGCLFLGYDEEDDYLQVDRRHIEENNDSRQRHQSFSFIKYKRYLFVVLFLVADGALLLYPFFPFSDLESDLNSKIIEAVFGPSKRSESDLIPDAFRFEKYLIPGSFSLTGDYDNVQAALSASTLSYKTDGTICVPLCNLDVIRPFDASRPSPVIFHVHGGGWDSGNKSDPNTAIGFWLDRGYAFVSVQYRFPSLSPGATINDLLDDVEDAWKYIVANADNLGIDPENIIFYGDSAGGHLATTVAYRVNDPSIRGVINLFGATEWEFYVNSGRTKLEDLFFKNLIPADATREEARQLYVEVSASTYVNRNSPPTLTIHGESDSIVPIEVSEHLHSVLRANNVDELLIRVPFAEHNLDFGWYSKGGQITAYAMDHFFASLFQ